MTATGNANSSSAHRAITRVGLGTDMHRLGSDKPLILAHLPVEHDRGPISHSDGDVVLHAIIDGLAGAAGLGDIGEMFPDSDAAYKDIDSGQLLAEVVHRVLRKGWEVVNVDVTIQAERPKLSGYKSAMRAELARLLGIDPEAVNVKAKTGEGVDAIGRGEAIAAMALVGLTPRKPNGTNDNQWA